MAVAVPVEIALASLDTDAVLNIAEQRQAQQFHKSADRARYRAAHGLKRLLLGAAVNIAPPNLSFAQAPGGKPYLEPERPGHLDFNLSHGGDWVAVGLSWSGKIGVDVEADHPDDFWQKIVSAIISPGESVDRGFLRAWTAKEAALKAHGIGLATAANHVAIEAGAAERFSAELPSGQGTFSGIWQRLDAMHMLAVATNGTMPQITVCRNADSLRKVFSRLGQAALMRACRKDFAGGHSCG